MKLTWGLGGLVVGGFIGFLFYRKDIRNLTDAVDSMITAINVIIDRDLDAFIEDVLDD